MSLKQAYLNFLSNPSNSVLSNSNPGFHYVTTTTSVNGSSAIVSHLKAARIQYEKKTERVVSSFESNGSLLLEIETTIKFKNSGGNFLPGLEDNFLTDQTVTFVLIHIVNFQGNLIHQVRLYWDQSTLLKQVGVIGRSGLNWPIRDGQDQCKLATESASGASTSSGEGEEFGRNRAMSTASMSSNSSIRPTRDPHSTLSLFAPREHEPETPFKPAVIPPRSSAKPPPRDLRELFAGSDEPDSSELTPPESSRNHKPSLDPKKYSHFEFGNYEDEAVIQHQKAVPPPKINSKNAPSWDFSDFVTPEKKPTKMRKGDIRNLSWSDNEEETQASPIKPKKASVPRNDAEPHFDFKDIDTPEAKEKSLTNSLRNNARRGVTSQIVIADESPANTKPKNELPTSKKANMINSHWDFDDHEHKDGSEQLGGGNRTIYKTVGDGMGGRKNLSSHWSFEDSPNGKSSGNAKENGQPKGQPKAANRSIRGGTQPTSGFWDF